MLRKPQVEVFKDGKWEPIRYKLNYKRILLAVLFILLFGLIIIMGLRFYRSESIAATPDSSEIRTEEDTNEIVAVADLFGKKYAFDTRGTAYEEREGKLVTSANLPFSLGPDEILSGAFTSNDGVIFGINNTADNLSKFILWDGYSAKEDKVLFDTEIVSNKEKDAPLFVTKQGKFILRLSVNRWLQIKTPTDIANISDYLLDGNLFYVLSKDENLWSTTISGLSNPNNRWTKIINSDEKDVTDADEPGNQPLILHTLNGEIFLLNRQGGVEDWSLRSEEKVLREYWSLQDIIRKKPATLGAYLVREVKTFNENTWCFISIKSAKCLNREGGYQIYLISNNQILVSEKSEFLIDNFRRNP